MAVDKGSNKLIESLLIRFYGPCIRIFWRYRAIKDIAQITSYRDAIGAPYRCLLELAEVLTAPRSTEIHKQQL